MVDLSSSKDYDFLELVGEGISGKVYKGIHKPTKNIVALKVIAPSKNQEKAAKEEVYLLQQLSRVPNVIPLRESIISPAHSEYVLVFPYFEHDLSGLLSENRISLPQAKCYLKQLLVGVNGIHTSGFMHRDIKAANLLLNNKGQLVIGDLGTATKYHKKGTFSDKVVTLWYRAPELLLGSTSYGPEVDMWSVGCVFIELVTSKNFFPGLTEQEQLDRIFKTCGSPTEENFPGVTQFPGYSSLPPSQAYPRRLRETLSKEGFPDDALELLDAMFSLDPSKRPTAQQALSSSFFTNEPLPLEPSQMPTYAPVHVLDLKGRKRDASDRLGHTSRNQHTHGAQFHAHHSSHHGHFNIQQRHQSPQRGVTRHTHHPQQHSPHHSPQHSPLYAHQHYRSAPHSGQYLPSPPLTNHTTPPLSQFTQKHGNSSIPESPQKSTPSAKVDSSEATKKAADQTKEKGNVQAERKKDLCNIVVHIPTSLYINGEWSDGPTANSWQTTHPSGETKLNPYLQPPKRKKLK